MADNGGKTPSRLEILRARQNKLRAAGQQKIAASRESVSTTPTKPTPEHTPSAMERIAARLNMEVASVTATPNKALSATATTSTSTARSHDTQPSTEGNREVIGAASLDSKMPASRPQHELLQQQSLNDNGDQSLQDQIASLQAERDDLKKKLNETRDELDMVRHNEKYEQELLQQRNDDLTEQVKTIQEEKTQLESKLHDTKDQLDIIEYNSKYEQELLELRNDELTEQIKNIQEEKERIERDLKDAHEDADLGDHNTKYELELLQQRNDELTGQFSKMAAEQARLQRELDEAKVELRKAESQGRNETELQQRNELLAQQVAEFQIEQNRLRQELDETRDELDSVRRSEHDEKVRLQEINDALNKDIEKSRADQEELRSLLLESRDEVEHLQQDLQQSSKLKEENTTLKDENASLKDANASLKSTQDQLQKQLQETREGNDLQNEKLREENSSLKATITELTDKAKQDEDKGDKEQSPFEAVQELEASRSLNQRLSSFIEELNIKVNELENKNKSVESVGEDSQKLNQRLSSFVEELNKRVTELETEKKSLRSEEQHKDELLSALRTEIQEATSANSSLQMELELSRDRLQRITLEAAKAQEEMYAEMEASKKRYENLAAAAARGDNVEENAYVFLMEQLQQDVQHLDRQNQELLQQATNYKEKSPDSKPKVATTKPFLDEQPTTTSTDPDELEQLRVLCTQLQEELALLKSQKEEASIETTKDLDATISLNEGLTSKLNQLQSKITSTLEDFNTSGTKKQMLANDANYTVEESEMNAQDQTQASNEPQKESVRSDVSVQEKQEKRDDAETQEELTSVQHKLDVAEGRCAVLEKSLEDFKEEFELAAFEADELSERLEEAHKEMVQLETDLTEQNAGLQRQVLSLEVQNRHLLEKVEAPSDSAAETPDFNNSDSGFKMQVKRSSLLISTTQLAESKARSSALELELDNLRSTFEDTTHEAEEDSDRLKIKEQEVLFVRRQKHELTLQVNHLEHSLKSLRAENERLKKFEPMTDDAETLEARCTALEGALNVTRDLFEEAKFDCDEFEELLIAKENEVDELLVRLEKANSESTSSDDAIVRYSALEDELSKILDLYENASFTIDDLRNQLEQKEDEITNTSDDYKQRCAVLEDEVERLLHLYENASAEVNDLKSAKVEYDIALEDAVKHIGGLQDMVIATDETSENVIQNANVESQRGAARSDDSISQVKHSDGPSTTVTSDQNSDSVSHLCAEVSTLRSRCNVLENELDFVKDMLESSMFEADEHYEAFESACKELDEVREEARVLKSPKSQKSEREDPPIGLETEVTQAENAPQELSTAENEPASQPESTSMKTQEKKQKKMSKLDRMKAKAIKSASKDLGINESVFSDTLGIKKPSKGSKASKKSQPDAQARSAPDFDVSVIANALNVPTSFFGASPQDGSLAAALGMQVDPSVDAVPAQVKPEESRGISSRGLPAERDGPDENVEVHPQAGSLAAALGMKVDPSLGAAPIRQSPTNDSTSLRVGSIEIPRRSVSGAEVKSQPVAGSLAAALGMEIDRSANAAPIRQVSDPHSRLDPSADQTTDAIVSKPRSGSLAEALGMMVDPRSEAVSIREDDGKKYGVVKSTNTRGLEFAPQPGTAAAALGMKIDPSSSATAIRQAGENESIGEVNGKKSNGASKPIDGSLAAALGMMVDPAVNADPIRQVSSNNDAFNKNAVPQRGSLAEALGMKIDPSGTAAPIRQAGLTNAPMAAVNERTMMSPERGSLAAALGLKVDANMAFAPTEMPLTSRNDFERKAREMSAEASSPPNERNLPSLRPVEGSLAAALGMQVDSSVDSVQLRSIASDGKQHGSDNIEEQLSNLEEMNRKLKERIEHLEHERKEQEEKQETRLAESSFRNSVLEGELENIETELEVLRSTDAGEREEVLEKELLDAKHEKEKLERQLQEAQSQLTNLGSMKDIEIDSLKKEYSRLIFEKQKAREVEHQRAVALESVVNDYKKECARLAIEAQQANDGVIQSRRQLNDTIAEKDTLQQELQNEKECKATLNETLEKLTGKVEGMNSEMRELDGSMESPNKPDSLEEIEMLKADIATLEETNSRLLKELEEQPIQLKKTISNLESTIGLLETSNDALRGEIEEEPESFDELIDELQGKVSTLETANEALQREIQSKTQDFNDEIEEIQAKVMILEKSNDALRDELDNQPESSADLVDDLQAKIMILERSNDALRSELDNNEAEASSADRVEELEAKIMILERSNDTLRNELENQADSSQSELMEELEAKIMILERSNEALREELDNQPEASSEQIDDLQAKIAILERSNEVLRGGADPDNLRALDEFRELHSKVQNLESENSSLKKSRSIPDNLDADVIEDLQRSTSDLLDSRFRNMDLTSRIEELESIVDRLETENRTLVERLGSAENGQGEDLLPKLRAELFDAASRESYLNQELSTCKSRLQQERHLLSCLSTELYESNTREHDLHEELAICYKKLELIASQVGLAQEEMKAETDEAFERVKSLLDGQGSFEERDAEGGDLSETQIQIERRLVSMEAVRSGATNSSPLHAPESPAHLLQLDDALRQNKDLLAEREVLQKKVKELEMEKGKENGSHKPTMEQRYNEMKSSLSSLTSVLEELNRANKGLAARNTQLENHLHQIKSERQSLIDRQEAIEAASQTHKSTSSMLSTQLSELKAQNSVLIQKNQELSEEIGNLLQTRGDYSNESRDDLISELRTQIDDLQKRNISLLEEIGQLMSPETVVESTARATQKQSRGISVGEGPQDESLDLRSRLEARDKELEDQIYCNGVLKDLVTKLNKMNDTLESKHKKKAEENKFLRTQNRNFTLSIEKLQKLAEDRKNVDVSQQNRALLDEVKFLRSQKKGYAQSILALETHMGKITRDKDRISAQFQELQRKLIDVSKENEELRDGSVDIAEEMEKFKKSQNDCSVEKESLQVEIGSLKKEKEELKEIVANHAREKRELEQRIAEKPRDREQDRAAVVTVDSSALGKLDVANKRSKHLEGQLAKAQQAIHDLASKMKALRQAHSKDLESANEREVRLTKELMKQRANGAAIESKLKERDREFEELEEDLESIRQEAHAMIEGLREQVKNLKEKESELLSERDQSRFIEAE